MRPTFAIAAIALLVIATASAQTVQNSTDTRVIGKSEVTLSGFLPDKTYTLVIETDAAGNIKSVGNLTLPPKLDVETLTIVDNPPGDPDPPGDLTGLAKVSFDQAKAVNDPLTAAELAKIYGAAASSTAGTFSQASQAAAVAQQLYLQQVGKAEAWAQWNEAKNQEIVRLATSGTQLTKDHLAQIAEGLSAASGTSQDALLGGIGKWLPIILEIVQAIISGEQIDYAGLIQKILLLLG